MYFMYLYYLTQVLLKYEQLNQIYIGMCTGAHTHIDTGISFSILSRFSVV